MGVFISFFIITCFNFKIKQEKLDYEFTTYQSLKIKIFVQLNALSLLLINLFLFSSIIKKTFHNFFKENLINIS